MTPELLQAAREWLVETRPMSRRFNRLADPSDKAVWREVRQQFAGGLLEFVHGGELSDAEIAAILMVVIASGEATGS